MKQFTLFNGVELTTNEKGAFKDISKLRGSLNPKTKVDIDEVYERASRLVTLVKQLLPQINHVLIKTPEELENVWQEIKRAGIVALDTESDVVGSNPNPFLDKIAGISVYTGGDNAYYIPINHHFYMSNVDARGFVHKIVEESHKGLKVIMHNAKYDAQVFYVYAQRTIKMYADTMIASRLLNENERAWGEDNGHYEAGHGLKYLWNKYCMNFTYSGDSYDDIFSGRKYGTFNPEKVFVYASLDAVMTLMLWKFQEQYIDSRYKGCKDLGLEAVSQLFFRVEMPVLQYATAMEIRGIGFNQDLNKELQHRYEKNILKARNDLISKIQPMIEAAKHQISPARFEKLSRPINMSSDTQLEILFYDILKLKLSESVQKQILRKKKKAQKNKDNAVNPNSVGKDAMAYFVQAYPEYAPLIKELLAYKELEKIYTAFIIGLRDKVNPKTGKIHAGWNTIGTDTGRFSSKSPNL